MKPTVNKTETDAHVLMPKPDVFEAKHVIESSIITTGYKYPVYERTEYPPEGGIYVYYKGTPYPKKGFPFPEGVWSNDVMKRISMTLVRSVGTKQMLLPILMLALMPWKTKLKIAENAAEQYARIGEWIHSACYLKEDKYSNAARAIRSILFQFLLVLGISHKNSDRIAKTIATIVEYDDAYRYRIEDIMSETNRTTLYEKPIREIRRLASIFLSREGYDAVQITVKALNFMTTLALLHPKIRKAFKSAIQYGITPEQFKWLQLDNADRYHVLLRGDYNFTGRTFEERKKLFVDCHTYSKCCKNGVIERKIPKVKGGRNIWETVCKKCDKQCEWYQEFPPEVEVASYNAAPQ